MVICFFLHCVDLYVLFLGRCSEREYLMLKQERGVLAPVEVSLNFKRTSHKKCHVTYLVAER